MIGFVLPIKRLQVKPSHSKEVEARLFFKLAKTPSNVENTLYLVRLLLLSLISPSSSSSWVLLLLLASSSSESISPSSLSFSRSSRRRSFSSRFLSFSSSLRLFLASLLSSRSLEFDRDLFFFLSFLSLRSRDRDLHGIGMMQITTNMQIKFFQATNVALIRDIFI